MQYGKVRAAIDEAIKATEAVDEGQPTTLHMAELLVGIALAESNLELAKVNDDLAMQIRRQVAMGR